jgi:hypothetical protein
MWQHVVVEIHPRSEGSYCLHLQVRRINPGNNQQEARSRKNSVCLPLRPWRWRNYVPVKRHWTCIGLKGVTSRKTVSTWFRLARRLPIATVHPTSHTRVRYNRFAPRSVCRAQWYFLCDTPFIVRLTLKTWIYFRVAFYVRLVTNASWSRTELPSALLQSKEECDGRRKTEWRVCVNISVDWWLRNLIIYGEDSKKVEVKVKLCL